MARQYISPGGGFIGDDGTAEYLSPGAGILNESTTGAAAGITFNADVLVISITLPAPSVSKSLTVAVGVLLVQVQVKEPDWGIIVAVHPEVLEVAASIPALATMIVVMPDIDTLDIVMSIPRFRTVLVGTDMTARELPLAEIYEFTLGNSVVLRFTSHDADISYGGNTWQAIPIRRGPIRYHANLEVDKVEVEMGLVGITVGAQAYTIPQCIRRDYFRNAKVRIWVINSEVLKGPVQLWEGWVTGQIGFDGGILSVEVGSILDKLQEKFPKVLFSEFCNHVHYSQAPAGAVYKLCELDKATWQESGTTGTGTTITRIFSTVFAFTNQAEGYWNRGTVTIDSVDRTIRGHYDGYVDLLIPFPDDPGVGTALVAIPGCDRTGVMCDEVFDNYANFSGFETIPMPEILYGKLT